MPVSDPVTLRSVLPVHASATPGEDHAEVFRVYIPPVLDGYQVSYVTPEDRRSFFTGSDNIAGWITDMLAADAALREKVLGSLRLRSFAGDD